VIGPTISPTIFNFAGHVAEDFVGLPFGWDQPDDGFAGLTAVQYLIHNRQAVRFELTGRDLFHNMVILL
jgi:hypothetical protein